jgi:type IV pilus assembly protein PilO
MALLPTDPQKRKYVLYAAILLGLANYALFSQLYEPRAAEKERVESRLENLERQNRNARRTAEGRGVAEVERQLALYRDQLVAVEGLIPSGEELPDLLDAISAEARRSGVELARIQPTGATREEYYTRREYALSVRGGYHQIGEFLTRVGSLPRIITPINLALSPTGAVDDDGTPMLSAEFAIETYVLPSAAEARAAQEDA